MLIFRNSKNLHEYLQHKKSKGLSVGFAPTMGALHEGHLSLIQRAKAVNDITVCSIFVNPTQFNESSDLEKYPRTEDKDVKLLQSVGCDIVFIPSVAQVYPDGDQVVPEIDFGKLATVMEGAKRPGHFQGVVQVVKRLLDITIPDQLYMGQKDYQQFAIVTEMIRQFEMPVENVRVPIKRETTGLAMSSRNARLSAELKSQAQLLHDTLQAAKSKINDESPKAIQEWAMAQLAAPAHFKPEYFDIVDGVTLQPIDSFSESTIAVACLACWVGEVRLIDNIILKQG